MIEPQKIKVPRRLKGRRERAIYLKLAPVIAPSGIVPPHSDVMLIELCGKIAEAERGQTDIYKHLPPTDTDLDYIAKLARLLGLKP